MTSAASRDVAIIGMACRFPGADSPGRFWANLCEGVESITFFSDAELLAAGVDPALLREPSYVRAAALLTDADSFDAAFFEYSPREATLMDPQQRLFLEVAWQAFEDAGYHPESCPGVVGVFAGGGGVVTSYLAAHPAHPALRGQTASLPHIGNDKDFLSTRVSYKLNLTGPSITVQTACSTSLVAVHLACQSLLVGESDMVLAGAATVRIPQVSGYLAEKGNVHSLDGHCRAFDAGGQGTIFGSGVAAVILKRLADALADGDHVYAVIKGTAVNNDGGRKVSYTAPSALGQARAMVEALTLADVPADTVRYVECHATGTTVGDPLEIQALSRAFQTASARTAFCALGSVKTNIGHPEQTAGLASLIKAALVLRHRRVPPSLHFVTPNPRIDFARSPFFVNAELRDWPADAHPRRAAVNSLGIGGTNAFVVLEEPPAAPAPPAAAERTVHVLTLSAKSDAALRAYAARFRELLGARPEASLADICYTSNVSRAAFGSRLAVTGGTLDELMAGLADGAGQPISRGEDHRPVFLFTGQGAQHPGMGAQLYRAHPTFREAIDECDAILAPHLDRSLIELLFADERHPSPLDETGYTQPALFAIEYALCRLWRSWGVEPAAVIGHSIGELVAACVAGVMGLAEALALVAARGRLMQALPRTGAMAAVAAGEDAVRPHLAAFAGKVAIAAINSPQSSVVSGERSAVERITAALAARGLATQALAVSHAFHSHLVEPMLDEFSAAAGRVAFGKPEVPLASNVTGALLEQAPDASYWRSHVRHPVRFADGLRTLHELGHRVFLEIGPGNTLLGFGRQTLPGGGASWIPSLSRTRPDWHVLMEAAAALYAQGFPIDWGQVHRGAPRRRVPLPTYPFQRKRYWVDGVPPPAPRPAPAGVDPSPAEAPSTPPRNVLERTLGVHTMPYLADHRIGGRVVLPTAAGIEAALAAGRSWMGSRALLLENVVYHRPLVFGEGETRRIRVTLRPETPTRAAFQLTSPAEGGDGEWRIHMSGVVEAAAGADPVPEVDANKARARCRNRIAPARFYAAVRDMGLDYGPSFRGIRGVRHGRGEAVAEVALPRGVARDGEVIHPALLDACLHVYPVVLSERGGFARRPGPRGEAYLPVGIERFRLLREPPDEASAHAVLREGTRSADVRVVDVRVFDKGGRLVAALEGLSLRRLPVDESNLAVPARPSRDWLYQVRWMELPAARPAGAAVRAISSAPAAPAVDERAGAGTWLVFADGQGVGRALAGRVRRAGHRCHLIVPGRRFERTAPGEWTLDPRRPEDFQRLVGELQPGEGDRLRGGAVFLWALDSPPAAAMTVDRLATAQAAGAGGALFLTQALTAAREAGRFDGRLWLVTRNAQAAIAGDGPTEIAQAPLWGLGRTIALETPALWGGLIDVCRASPARSVAESLTRAILSPDGEDQIALRGGKRLGARLVRAAVEATDPPAARIRPDGTYLVTGGLGMLGLRTARWLVEVAGVRSLVLVGRTARSSASRQAVAALQSRGARVHLVQADVGVEPDVRRVFASLGRLPRLRGVFHCAGVLDDGVLAQMSWDKFTRATRPKVQGAWLLHRYTRTMALDLFVLHSSLLSLTGSAGQANYTAANAFLDALAAHRRALGLPATAINWGPWDEAGMARASGARGEAIWQSRGVRYLPPVVGMRALADVLDSGTGQVAVADVDWPVFAGQFATAPRFYAILAPMTGAADARPSAATLREAGAAPPPSPRAPGGRRAAVVDTVRRQVMTELGFDDTIDTRQPLNELGLDSLMSVNVANRLESRLGIAVPLVKLIQGPSIEQLVDELFPDLAGPPDTETGPFPGPTAPETTRTSETAGGGWLVFPRPNPSARLRLFCFPFAGGGAATYRPWAELLDPAVELIALEPPGRGTRIDEQAITRMQPFVEAAAAAIRPFLDRPAAFFGHCWGGLTAFEIARQIRRERPDAVAHLFVSGARPPHRLGHEGRFEHNLLQGLLDQPRFDPLRAVHEQPDDVFAEVIRHFNIGATDEFLAKPELRRLLLPAVRADFAMASGYRFEAEPPWDIPITAFTGLDDPYAPREDAVGWSEYTRRDFRLHLREGAHFLIVEDRQFIVETINRELVPE